MDQAAGASLVITKNKVYALEFTFSKSFGGNFATGVQAIFDIEDLTSIAEHVKAHLYDKVPEQDTVLGIKSHQLVPFSSNRQFYKYTASLGLFLDLRTTTSFIQITPPKARKKDHVFKHYPDINEEALIQELLNNIVRFKLQLNAIS